MVTVASRINIIEQLTVKVAHVWWKPRCNLETAVYSSALSKYIDVNISAYGQHPLQRVCPGPRVGVQTPDNFWAQLEEVVVQKLGKN